MLSEILRNKSEISELLRAFLVQKKQELAQVNDLAADACDRLQEFVLSGKMIRGCLVPFGLSLCHPHAPASDVHLARLAGAAMELFQSGLLVHDDIMDRDLTRRGQATIFQQYRQDAQRRGVSSWRHIGDALGTCVGDIAFFLAYEMIGRLASKPSALGSVLTLLSRELAAVGLAQMQDVSWGASSSADLDEDQILRLYKFKTSRYSFSLPLTVGGVLAGAGPAALESLMALGECIGIIFQIRDDELGLFGDEGQTGKPVGSDVREGKKTLLHARLIAHAPPQEIGRLSAVLGNGRATREDLDYVRRLALSSGVQASIQRTVHAYEEKARAIIRDMQTCTEEDRGALEGLLEFTTARRS